ncbi:hypothetical protein ES702_02288 [subsurface metagenome]
MSDDISKIRKDAWICYNRYANKGYCSATYKTANKVCLYCLEYIKRIKNPNKREMSNTNLKDTPNNEIEIPKYEIKKFKFPIDLMEFSIKEPLHFIEVGYEEETSITAVLEGLYGRYMIETTRAYKLMDLRILLGMLYFMDYHKDRYFKERVINWLELLEFRDTGFYRKGILEGLDYLKKTTFYTPYIYDVKNKKRPEEMLEISIVPPKMVLYI